MGTRTAAATAEGVVEYARGFLAGLAAQDVAGCAKHFPGLGASTRDSHLETPAIERGWQELWREDLAPYRELRNELPIVMVNHAGLSRDAGERTAGERFKLLDYGGAAEADRLWRDYLLGRSGDGRHSEVSSMEEAAVAAIRAGMDTLEICHSP